MLNRFLIIIPLLLSFSGISQREHNTGLHFGFGKTSSITGDIVKNFKLLKSEKLFIGAGARAGVIYSSDKISFYTAPAKYAKEQDGIDTMRVNKPIMVPVNVSISVSYFLNNKLSAGIFIDIAGFTFGGKKKSDFYPSLLQQKSEGKRNVLNEQYAKPMINNFNMIGNYRKGTTFNEVFVRYQVHERFSVKANFLLITTEYISEKRIAYKSNYRFRNTSTQFGIGLSYHFI